MKSIGICCVLALYHLTIHASAPHSDILITGTVTDGNTPVENAVVTLVNNSLPADTTDSKGSFLLSNMTDISRKSAKNFDRMVRLHGKRLHFSIPAGAMSGEVKLCTGSGRCMLRHSLGKELSGPSSMELPDLSAGLYIVAFSADGLWRTRKLVVTSTNQYLSGTGNRAVPSGGLPKPRGNRATVDRLRITKEGFVAGVVEIPAYRTENLSIVLEPDTGTPGNEKSLFKKYRHHFPVGAAIDGNSYRDSHAALWKEHFNAAVCENEMKWASLQPTEGSFQFSQANAMVNAARSAGMLVRGHVLVWFDQTPDWVFQGPSGGQASKELLLQRIRTHVKRVMQEFKGRVYAWDVVNEAVIGYDSGNKDVGEDLGALSRWGYRDSKWHQIAGEDHIFEAFRAARNADPDARLFYNDFWNYLDGKREFILSFVKRLREENLIDGVGLQCHLNISPAMEKMNNQSVYQTIENLEKEIREYSALGLDVHVTELDVSIYTRDYTSDDRSRWYNGNDLNEEYQDRLAARYGELFDMFRRNAGRIQNVTFWGISDDNTWLSEFTSGRPDHPLLFDRHLQPKKAFDAVMDF